LKGAFTGALSDKKGAFESAAGGTVFLNGVEQLSPPLQVRLLRVLQNGTLERAGGETTIHVDARVICATNRNLKEDVTRGRFRQDLYYRISVVPIHLPALRKRPLDIPLLAQHTLDQETERLGRQRVSLSHQALSALINYPWPGNFSELQRCLIAALTEGSGEIIEKHDLASQVSQFGQPPLFSRARKRKLTEAMVAEALEKTAGNKVKAAKVLGVSRATLYRFLSQKRPV
ncbi:MAG: sigma 54-interacting transcriptional regulator, partial [Thermoanaerobaculia bacterium]